MPQNDDTRTPLVSAVIPTRNRPELVCRAVNSALGQTYAGLEVIVVVDGPDQATMRALEGLHEPRLRIIQNAENVGQAEAKNIGVRMAQGKWIALLDDDDEWLPHKIDRQLAVAQQLEGDFAFVVSRFIEKTSKLERVIPHVLPQSTRHFSEYLYCKRGNLQTSTLFISRFLLLQIPFTKGLRIEDTDWLLRAADDERTRIGVVEEPLSVYHNAATGNRETGSGSWESLFTWGVTSRTLFTRKALSLFFSTQCVSRARQNNAPVGVLALLFLTGALLGKCTLQSLTHFVGYFVFSANTRRQVRLLFDRSGHKKTTSSQAIQQRAQLFDGSVCKE